MFGRYDHRSITFLRMRSNEAAYTCRNGKGHHEVDAWQELFKLCIQPSPCVGSLASRTMSIAARLRSVMIASTLLTSIDRRASFRSSTSFDRRHRLKLFRMHLLGVLLAISRTVSAKDFSDGRLLSSRRLSCTSCHLRAPSNRRP